MNASTLLAALLACISLLS